MGGDEFLFVLTHVDEKHIRLTVERLREHFASIEVFFWGRKHLRDGKFRGLRIQGQRAYGILSSGAAGGQRSLLRETRRPQSDQDRSALIVPAPDFPSFL